MIKAIVTRDPDGDTYVELFDGQGKALRHVQIEEIDPGRGYSYEEDWLPRIEEARGMPESDYRTALLSALEEPPGQDYIEGYPA